LSATGTGVSEEAARSWRLLPERLEQETDELVRRNLESVAHHVVAEVGGELDELMATLVADPHYKFLGTVAGSPVPIDLDGPEAIRTMYQQTIDIGGNRLEFELSCVVADRKTVVTEGVFRQAYPGSMVLQYELRSECEVDPEGWYLSEYPALVVWPVDENGLIEGERVYFGDYPVIKRPLAADELPHLGPVDRGAK
jgi:hypothetical protein